MKLRKKRGFKVEKNENYLFNRTNFGRKKGIDVFCEAYLPRKVPGIVIGEGPLKKEYEEKYPAISFVGWKKS